jgi:hypothetical protein
MPRVEVKVERGGVEWPDAEAIAYRPSGEIVMTHLLSNEHMGIILAARHAQAALPEEILVGTLRDGRLRVHSPIRVKVVRDGKQVVTEATEINEFGFGENLSESLADLQATVCELYWSLMKDRHRLGPELERAWETLQRKIDLRP